MASIYKITKDNNIITGRDLMLRSAFLEEIENIEARIKNNTFYHPSPDTLIDYFKSRIKEIGEMKNANI
tara:strand:+ start:614 stop:820 length:207 start_codon:yes stop_codon:yes gene_type:complete